MVAERAQQPQTAPAAAPSMCKNGHKRTYKNRYRDSEGTLRCFECLRETRQRWLAKQPHTGRRRALCAKGHPMTPENTMAYASDRGRRCRICRGVSNRASQRRLYAREKLETSVDTTPAGNAAVRPSERPLGVFDAVVAAAAAKLTGFTEERARADEARRERARAEVGALAGPLTATADQVIWEAAELCLVEPAALTGKGKDGPVSRARRVAIYALHSWCGLTVTDLSRLFGRDHTTIGWSRDKVARLVAAGDAETLADLRALRFALVEGATT